LADKFTAAFIRRKKQGVAEFGVEIVTPEASYVFKVSLYFL
jgi:hypothetical protein